MYNQIADQLPTFYSCVDIAAGPGLTEERNVALRLQYTNEFVASAFSTKKSAHTNLFCQKRVRDKLVNWNVAFTIPDCHQP